MFTNRETIVEATEKLQKATTTLIHGQESSEQDSMKINQLILTSLLKNR